MSRRVMRKSGRYQQVPPVLLRQRNRFIKLFAVALAQLQHGETAPVQTRNLQVLAEWKIVPAFLYQHLPSPLAICAHKHALHALFAFRTQPSLLHGPHVSHYGVKAASSRILLTSYPFVLTYR